MKWVQTFGDRHSVAIFSGCPGGDWRSPVPNFYMIVAIATVQTTMVIDERLSLCATCHGVWGMVRELVASWSIGRSSETV